MSSLDTKQVNHLVRLLKQKFISPFKIIYMIDQKQADYFKCRNQNTGCCTATEITIATAEQTKIQRYLSQFITMGYIKNNLEELLSYCEDRYKNIVQKGKQDHLKITNQVQKYLIDNILGQSVNNFIHKKLVQKLALEANSISKQIGLWATPATWFAKYPHHRLQLFEPKQLGELFTTGYTVISQKLNPFLQSVYNDLLLLQKDGRFQQILWKNKGKQIEEGNQLKILRNPQIYCQKNEGQKNFLNLGKVCLLLQSIPFELNMKANCYLTVNDVIQAYYYQESAWQANKKLNNCKYEFLISTAEMEINIEGKQNITLKAGSLFVISSSHAFKFQSENKNNIFILRSVINQAQRQQ